MRTLPKVCVNCGHRTSNDQQYIAAGTAKRRSRKNPYRCVGCAGTRIYGRGPGSGGYVEPRYCTCYGDVPPPSPQGECPDCRRLVESRASA